MLIPQQLTTSCDLCCNFSPFSNHNSSSRLFTIKERDCHIIITCYNCHGEMASIPHTMQLVKSQKKRYNQAKASNALTTGYFNPQDTDKPNRYSSKKMNAIWGMYNRDSVHNFKSMACDGVTAAEIQAVAQGSDLLLGNQDMYHQQQFQQQQFQQQDFQQLNQGKPHGMFGELGKAVSANFLENIYHYC